MLTFEPEHNAPPTITSYYKTPKYKAEKRLETGAVLELLETLIVKGVSGEAVSSLGCYRPWQGFPRISHL